MGAFGHARGGEGGSFFAGVANDGLHRTVPNTKLKPDQLHFTDRVSSTWKVKVLDAVG